MKQYRFTAQDHSADATIPDAVMDTNDPAFQMANGVVPRTNYAEMSVWADPSQEKARMMRENGIKPGTQEWFRLWFAK